LQNIILDSYSALLTIEAGIEKAGSLDGTKVAHAIQSIPSVPTTIPGTSLSYTPNNHWGFPTSSLKMCSLQTGPYDLVLRSPECGLPDFRVPSARAAPALRAALF
jgi:hypothetical protein